MKITYETWNPNAATLTEIERAERICAEYARQGYDLTLRQLYYQFVARAWIPNTDKSYKRLGEIVNKARLAGLLDWSYIVDRTRSLRGVSHWETPGEIIESAARSFRLDKWADQPTRVEVWVEKEALAGVVQRAAEGLDVDWFSCRGYVSQSELWAAARRLSGYLSAGQDVVVLHLGDHDPSGIDMSRDIRTRLELFVGHDRPWDVERLTVKRIALNMDQVEQYEPPPNPTKLTDSRAHGENGYVARYGNESWELDALDPATLAALVRDEISDVMDRGRFEAQERDETRHRDLLDAAADRWAELVDVLDGNG